LLFIGCHVFPLLGIRILPDGWRNQAITRFDLKQGMPCR
jgi:hypothetical protein